MVVVQDFFGDDHDELTKIGEILTFVMKTSR